MGSARRKEIVNVPEISLLVNRPRSKLADLWKRDTLHGWADSLNDPVPEYEPGEAVRKRLRKTLLPGEKCDECRKNRTR